MDNGVTTPPALIRFLLLDYRHLALFAIIAMPAQSSLPFCYPGQITQYIRPNQRVFCERFVPSFITNIPRTEQRASIMGLLYRWMESVADERKTVVSDSFSFLRLLWYLPDGLPPTAWPGVRVLIPGLGSLYLTDECEDDLQNFVRWIRVRIIWLDDLKQPVRFGAIGVPMKWRQLPENQRAPLSWSSKLRARLYDHFPSLSHRAIIPLHLQEEEPRVGPGLLQGNGADPYFRPMGMLDYEGLAPLKTVVKELEYGSPGGVYIVG